MRNSAWYHKLWLKKLSELPLKEDAEASWADMKDLLDTQLPVGGSVNHNVPEIPVSQPLAAKLVKIFSLARYVLPAAAAVGLSTYLLLPLIHKTVPVESKKKQEIRVSADTIGNNLNSVVFDKDTVLNKNNTLNDTSIHVNDLKSPVSTAKELKSIKRSQTSGSVLSFSQVSIAKTENDTNKKYDDVINTQSDEGIITLADPFVKVKSVKVQDVLFAKEKPVIQLITDQSKVSAVHEKITASGITAPGITDLKNTSTETETAKAKTANNTVAKIATPKKGKSARIPKIKTGKINVITPRYDFGLEVGWNAGKSNSFYLGALGSYRITTLLRVNAGLRLNTPSELSGNYTTIPTDVFGDPFSHYQVSDSRKIMVLNLPLTVEYKVSNRLSINAGPVFGLLLSQSNIKNLSGSLKDSIPSTVNMDFIHRRYVDSALTHTSINKMNLGLTGGLSYRFRQFYIEARYLQNLRPYKLTNTLGSYQQDYRSLQLGIRYKFKQ